MNREKNAKYGRKGYYQTHPCKDTFVCQNCGKPFCRTAQEPHTAITAPSVSSACIWIWNRETGKPAAAGAWSP